jgi:hypothetical protein
VPALHVGTDCQVEGREADTAVHIGEAATVEAEALALATGRRRIEVVTLRDGPIAPVVTGDKGPPGSRRRTVRPGAPEWGG